MPNADFEKGTKVCQRTDCDLAGQPQPLERFEKHAHRSDGLRPICKRCRNRLRYGVKKEAAAEKLQNTTLMLSDAAHKPGHTIARRVTHIEELAGNLVHAFGGVDRLSSEFASVIRNSKNDNAKIRGFSTVFQVLADASAKEGANDGDTSLITDAELEERMLQIAQRLQATRAIDVEFKVQEPEPERESISPSITKSSAALGAAFSPQGAGA